MEGTDVLRYIYTSPLCCSHAQHTLSRPQRGLVAAEKGLARLLIITSRRKVSVLGLVTKSILKICIWQQLGVLGHAACSEQEGARHVAASEEKKKNYISKQRLSGRSGICSQSTEKMEISL